MICPARWTSRNLDKEASGHCDNSMKLCHIVVTGGMQGRVHVLRRRPIDLPGTILLHTVKTSGQSGTHPKRAHGFGNSSSFTIILTLQSAVAIDCAKRWSVLWRNQI